MFHNKATTYEQMEKPKKEKKFKQNAYEEIRKLIEENEGNETVKDASAVASRSIRIRVRRKTIIKKILINLNYLIKYKFKLYLIKLSMLFIYNGNFQPRGYTH